jgi:cysteine-rich repeat protein
MFRSRVRCLPILTSASLVLVAAPASADVELGAPMVVIDFSDFAGTGFAPEPAPGQLDSDDWAIHLNGQILDFGGTEDGGDFARGLDQGSDDNPGIHAYDVDGAGLIALGVQPTTSVFTPGSLRLRLVNNTGADIDEFRVDYTVWINNDTGWSISFSLSHSPDNVDYTSLDDPSDPFRSTEEADASGFTAFEQEYLITPTAPIADRANYYIAWEGDEFSGDDTARDEFGLEGITIRLFDVCGNGIVEEDLGEQCDDGLDNADDAACRSTCVQAFCGDGLVYEGVEECDDGNGKNGDGCSDLCFIEETSGTTGGGSESGSQGTQTTGTQTSSGTTTTTTTTDASATTTSPATAGTDTDDNDGESENDEQDGCGCGNSRRNAPIWGLLGMILALVRRRR